MALVPFTPAVTIEVAFTNNPLDGSLTWTDVTEWHTGFTCSNPLGRQHQLDRVQPTSYTVTFTNNDGRFTPTNTSSPYYHSPSTGTGMVPGKPMRILSTWPQSGGTVYPVAYGLVDNWKPQIVDASRQTATCQFTDLFKLFNGAYLNNPTLFPDLILTLGGADLQNYYRLSDSGPPTVFDSGPSQLNGTIGGVMGYQAEGNVLYDPAAAMDFSAGTGQPSGWVQATGTPTNPQTIFGSFLCNPIDPTLTPLTGFDQTVAYFPGNPTINANETVLQITAGGQMLLNHGTFPGNVLVPANPGADIYGPSNMNNGMPHWWQITEAASGGNFIWTLWVDGVSYGSVTLAQPNDGPVIWGGFQGVLFGEPWTYPAFNGVMQDVGSFSPLALTSSQIQSIFTTGSYLQVDQLTGARINAALVVAGVGSVAQNLAAGTMPCAPETSEGVQTTSGAVPVGQQVSSTPLETAITQTLLGDYIMTANDSENGFLYQDQSGTIQFKDRHYPQLNSTTTTSQATIGDNTSTSNHYETDLSIPQDDLDLWPSAQVQRNNGQIETSTDAASQTAFGPRTYELSGLLFDQDLYSTALAQWITYLYAWPLPRVGAITLSSTTNAGGMLPLMLGLNLWDSITVQRQGPGEAQTSIFCCIESIAHTWDGSKWTTKLVLSPFEVSAKANLVLLLNNATDGTLDSTNVLGG